MLKHSMFGTRLEVETFKKCTPLWREAHFEVKMYKAHRVQSTFGSWDAQKVHAVVARSTFRSQNAQGTSASEHFWKLRCWKSHAVVARSTFVESNMLKTYGLGPLLDVQMSFRVAGARDSAPCQKWAKHEGFVAVSKTLASVGHVKRIWKDAFRVAGAVQESMVSRDVRRSERWFPQRRVAFWSIRSSGLLRWFCVTGATLRMAWPHFFVASAILYTHENGKIAKRIGTRPSDLHSTFHFWRKSRGFASFLMLSTSKIEDVSQNCFVFDMVKFKNWRSLA